MLKIDNLEVFGWEHAIRGMRNPKNSWSRSDSSYCSFVNACAAGEVEKCESCVVGHNDHNLMMHLAFGGPVHAKYRRMITVYMDIVAPLYWWKEFDTYKVGTVANSCSTMHKIHDKMFTFDDFSHEHLLRKSYLGDTIAELNMWRDIYLNGGTVGSETCSTAVDIFEPNDKRAWWQMIQLLPSSYNQKRTVMLNYETLANIYKWRRNHKLDEWHTFCDMIEDLPYSEIITLKEE